MLISLIIEKFNYIQGGKCEKGPSEQILIFVFDDFYVIACDLKILIYKVNSPYKQKVYSLELFLVIFRKYFTEKTLINFENEVGYLLKIFLLKVFFDTLIEHIKS